MGPPGVDALSPGTRESELRMHPRSWSALSAAAVLLLAACDAPPEPTSPDFHRQRGVTGSATGGGHFDAGVDVTFAFGAVQLNGFDAVGALFFTTELGGEKVEFHGRIICLGLDGENDRAWIGAVVTKNRSTHPSFTGEIHQPGEDVWFRVVDYGEGRNAEQPDRTTFLGFKGAAGIDTSVDYCEAKIWPGPPDDEVDARTGPVTQGNLQVRVRGADD